MGTSRLLLQRQAHSIHMIKTQIKKGQVWQHKHSGKQVQVYRKAGGDWIILSLDGSEFQGSASHKVAPQTLWSKFLLK